MKFNVLHKVPHGTATPIVGSQPVQRVKSMFQQSTGKLTPPRLPSHPPPPQRSISHSEVSSSANASSDCSSAKLEYNPAKMVVSLVMEINIVRTGILQTEFGTSSSSITQSQEPLVVALHRVRNHW